MSYSVKAKFHYAIQVADLVADLLARASSLLTSQIVRDGPNSSSLQVCDQATDQGRIARTMIENLTVKPALSKLGCRRLGKVTGSGTKPRRLLVHLTSEQNAQDLLSSANLRPY